MAGISFTDYAETLLARAGGRCTRLKRESASDPRRFRCSGLAPLTPTVVFEEGGAAPAALCSECYIELVGYVYFIGTDLDSPIKIGHSYDPWARVGHLQVAHPEELSVLALDPGGKGREALLHARFAEHRLRGEWFAPHADLVSYIHRILLDHEQVPR